MRPDFLVHLNQAEWHRVACAEEADRLCDQLVERPVFTIHVTDEGGRDASLDVFVESGRALVNYLDIGRGIKLASRDEKCTRRGIVSLTNDAFPDLDLDLIEVQYRDLISPSRAIAILRHYLKTGEPIDLVPYPSEDCEEWSGELKRDKTQPLDGSGTDYPGEDIPF